MTDGLAFFPVEDVEEGMAYLKDQVPTDGLSLLDYFTATYVSSTCKVMRCPAADGSFSCTVKFKTNPPLYAPALWNVHDITMSSGDSTINHCECWNNVFNKQVGPNHPSVWRLITYLREDERMMCTVIQQENRGEQSTKSRSKTTKDLQRNYYTSAKQGEMERSLLETLCRLLAIA